MGLLARQADGLPVDLPERATIQADTAGASPLGTGEPQANHPR